RIPGKTRGHPQQPPHTWSPLRRLGADHGGSRPDPPPDGATLPRQRLSDRSGHGVCKWRRYCIPDLSEDHVHGPSEGPRLRKALQKGDVGHGQPEVSILWNKRSGGFTVPCHAVGPDLQGIEDPLRGSAVENRGRVPRAGETAADSG